jgi:diacylglycerol kinase family enzyme
MVDSLAIRLNSKAGNVTSRLEEEIKKHFRDDLGISFYEECSRDEIIQRKPQIIALGGGDGTVKYETNKLIQILKSPDYFNQQTFALLKMGTGNGLSYEVKATKKHIKQLEAILNCEFDNLPLVEISLIEIKHKDQSGKTVKNYSPFTGVGWDAIILSWYNQFKKSGFRGLAGYLAAVAPAATEVLTGKKPEFEITFPKGAKLVYEFGKKANYFECSPGNNYRFAQESDVHSIVAGTSKYFGFNFIAFPHAEIARENKEMHLRAIAGNRYLTIMELINNALPIWLGKYRSKNVYEIITPEVEINVSNGGIKMQASGEDLGQPNNVTWKVSDYKLRLVDYSKMKIK